MNSILLALFFLGACGQKDTSTQVETRAITESVYASGTIKAQAQYNVYAEANGLLKHILLSEGDSVKKGTPLFVLENQTSVLNTENARLAYSLTARNAQEHSNRLQELAQSVKAAREKLALDSALHVRQQNLWQQNIGSKVQAEQMTLAYETSKANYIATKARLDEAKVQFDIEHKQARNNLKINQAMEGNYTVRSEIDGMVYDILKEQGEWVSIQSPIAVIGNPDSYLLSLQVDENDIAKVRMGQLVLVNMDSYEGQTYKAQITKIYPIMNERSRTFTVEADFTASPPDLFPNLSAEANIVIQTKENALIIPREYLIENQYVLVDDEERVAVEVGLMDYQYVEIVEGLKEGQTIYKP